MSQSPAPFRYLHQHGDIEVLPAPGVDPAAITAILDAGVNTGLLAEPAIRPGLVLALEALLHIDGIDADALIDAVAVAWGMADPAGRSPLAVGTRVEGRPSNAPWSDPEPKPHGVIVALCGADFLVDWDGAGRGRWEAGYLRPECPFER